METKMALAPNHGVAHHHYACHPKGIKNVQKEVFECFEALSVAIGYELVYIAFQYELLTMVQSIWLLFPSCKFPPE
jgi:hypothetical protein